MDGISNPALASSNNAQKVHKSDYNSESPMYNAITANFNHRRPLQFSNCSTETIGLRCGVQPSLATDGGKSGVPAGIYAKHSLFLLLLACYYLLNT